MFLLAVVYSKVALSSGPLGHLTIQSLSQTQVDLINLHAGVTIFPTPMNNIFVHTFDFTGSTQLFITREFTSYLVEVWGAQGGSRGNLANGGRGGYSVGVFSTNSDRIILYIDVGGRGSDASSGSGGGGGTPIRNSSSLSTSSHDYRIIVAGGGSPW